MSSMAMHEHRGLVVRALRILILAFIPIETPRASAKGGDDAMAPNVLAQLQLPKHHGESLGYWLGSSTTPTIGGHTNGMARSDGAKGTPFMYVAHAEDGGEIVVVSGASRDSDGERLRSDRQRRYGLRSQTPPGVNESANPKGR